MQVAYEDRVRGKMPEDICIGFIQKYSDEQKKLETEITEIEERLTETANTMQSADEFMRNIKKYLEAPELTREMCYELIDRIIVGGSPKMTGKEREIDIVYKVDMLSKGNSAARGLLNYIMQRKFAAFCEENNIVFDD